MIPIIKYALTAIFALSVFGKLTGKTKSTYEKANYPPSFRYFLALSETVLVAGLYTPYQLYAAIGLLCIMVGAVTTLFHQKAEPSHYILAFISSILIISLILQL